MATAATSLYRHCRRPPPPQSKRAPIMQASLPWYWMVSPGNGRAFATAICELLRTEPASVGECLRAVEAISNARHTQCCQSVDTGEEKGREAPAALLASCSAAQLGKVRGGHAHG